MCFYSIVDSIDFEKYVDYVGIYKAINCNRYLGELYSVGTTPMFGDSSWSRQISDYIDFNGQPFVDCVTHTIKPLLVLGQLLTDSSKS